VQWTGGLDRTGDAGTWRVVISEREMYTSETGTDVFLGTGFASGRDRLVYLDAIPTG
jgi:hypothetical protein